MSANPPAAHVATWRALFEFDREAQELGLPLVQGLLAQFVDYIKDRKTVMLDDVAAEFGLRTQDVINRIQSLESIGRLTGVMDDRGKVRPCAASK